MSQVFIRASFQGETVDVLAGWSRLESQVFVNVGYINEDGQLRDDVPLLLEAWKTVEERPTDIVPAAQLAVGIRAKLAPMGIDVPDMMLDEIARHIVIDAGNVIVRYDQAGNRELLAGDLTE